MISAPALGLWPGMLIDVVRPGKACPGFQFYCLVPPITAAPCLRVSRRLFIHLVPAVFLEHLLCSGELAFKQLAV